MNGIGSLRAVSSIKTVADTLGTSAGVVDPLALSSEALLSLRQGSGLNRVGSLGAVAPIEVAADT